MIGGRIFDVRKGRCRVTGQQTPGDIDCNPKGIRFDAHHQKNFYPGVKRDRLKGRIPVVPSAATDVRALAHSSLQEACDRVHHVPAQRPLRDIRCRCLVELWGGVAFVSGWGRRFEKMCVGNENHRALVGDSSESRDVGEGSPFLLSKAVPVVGTVHHGAIQPCEPNIPLESLGP